MEVVLHNVSKRYRFEWIFKGINFTFQAGQRYAILGPNGSGKSTFLKILSGHLSPSKGKIEFFQNKTKIDIDEVYRSVGFAAPYIELIEDFTLKEAIVFHQKFKPFLQKLQAEDIIKILGFQHSTNKEVKYFSSGMKQRLKLALTLCSDTSLLLLDEPTTNLDQQGFEWYRDLITEYGGDRLLIVASNVETDYAFCDHHLNMLDFKNK